MLSKARENTMSLLTYNEVTKKIAESRNKRKHLLIGNGFSIAYDKNIFTYDALSKFVEDAQNDLLKKLFRINETRNFEQIMRQLDITAKLIKEFEAEDALVEKIVSTSIVLKESLIEAIEKLHPEHVFKIKEEEIKMCASFIMDFVRSFGYIFSTNYDILLYWVLMKHGEKNSFDFSDGFGRDALDEDGNVTNQQKKPELYWGKYMDTQNIFFLHGSLPLFYNGVYLTKETYDNKKTILENITKRMDRGSFPLFATGGTYREKLNQILLNPYLRFCYDNLSDIEGSLVTFGFNFGQNDQHIINAINRSAANSLSSIYIGVYSKEDQEHIKAIHHKFKCKNIYLFDAQTAKIWR